MEIMNSFEIPRNSEERNLFDFQRISIEEIPLKNGKIRNQMAINFQIKCSILLRIWKSIENSQKFYLKFFYGNWKSLEIKQ
jgi:hypothetical protein